MNFIAAITQHIPGKSFQLVRYYGWYSNPAVAGRGQREKRAAEEAKIAGQAVEIIDDREVIERILPHLGLWEQDVSVLPARSVSKQTCFGAQAGPDNPRSVFATHS